MRLKIRNLFKKAHTPDHDFQKDLEKEHPNAQKRPGLEKQGGFTLVELMIVITIIGTVLALGARSFSNPTASADALLIKKSAQELNDMINTIAASCGTTTDVNTPVADEDDDGNTTAAEFLSMIMLGSTNAGYEACYEKSGVNPYGRYAPMKMVGGNAEFWLGSAYKIEFVGGGSDPVIIVFNDVPDANVDKIAKDINGDFDVATYTAATGEGSVYSAATAVTDTTEKLVPLSINRNEGTELSILKFRYP